ncbi:MAG: hypothetical protein COV45_01115 [Deltaproteobacteria bacterium CG11_big_fil_rev_8_21_14_0_20_47_16]|nr:MAG: hypothetical protein COV45_01115 [Deltaproteobacteria bacterium CG11_big_fil_rev_8_21_14_0_20_47_16]
MMSSLTIDPIVVLTIATIGIAFSYWLESRFRWARRIGNVIILITIGLILSNLHIIPFESSVYDGTMSIGIPISISLLLLRLDIKDLKTLDRQCVGYFFLCCIATIIGAVIAHLAFGSLIGEESWKLAGQLTASYTGGGENAVAVGTSLEVTKELFSSTFAADNIVTAIWMLICLSGPVGLGRFFSNVAPMEVAEAPKEQSKPFTSREFLPSLFYSLATAGVILVVSQMIGNALKAQGFVSWNTKIIWVTTLSLLVAQTPFRRNFKVSYLLGTLIFNYFFFAMGAISSIQEVINYGPRVFVYVTTVVVIHGIIVLGVGKMMKANLPKLLTASQAAIGGPATAAALAEANNWPQLVIPGVLMGIMGYAVANYMGFIIAFLMKTF